MLLRYARYGVVPLVIPELFPDTPMPHERIPFQKGTDLGYLNELAKANGHVFYLDPGPLPGVSRAYWGPEVRIGVPQRTLSVNMDGLSNVHQLTFSFDGSVWEFVMAWIRGAALVLGTKRQMMEGDALGELMNQEAIDIATLPPSALTVLDPKSLPLAR